uniref:Uncharacterized protein n=1 Tax=Anguilla anguilla TaxID=7936 RepID=A0A0E9VHJ9_ANGAN
MSLWGCGNVHSQCRTVAVKVVLYCLKRSINIDHYLQQGYQHLIQLVN